MMTAGTHNIPSQELLIRNAGTQGIGAGSSVSTYFLYFLPSGFSWEEGWELSSFLIAEIHPSSQGVLALTYLTVEEYGEGISVEEAVEDMLTSLSDYLLSLQARESRLAASAASDLAMLRALIRRKPHH